MRAAPRAGLLVAATLTAVACGGGHGDAKRHTPTPTGRGQSPTATATPTPREPALRPGPALTTQAVLKRIAGRRIEAGGRTVRIDAGTVTCGGLGRSSHRRHGQAAFTRFRCVQPTFPPGAVAGPDLIFVLQSAAPRRLVVTQRHFTTY